MNFSKLKNFKPNSVQVFKRTLTTENYPYTSELYKKNYIKYPVQSKQAILHDYIFHGDERLPNLEERLKEFRDPKELEAKQIGLKWGLPKLRDLKKKIEEQIKANKGSKELHFNSKEQKIQVPVDEIVRQTKILTAFKDAQIAAEHYGLFKDLFNYNYFRPVVDLKVNYGEHKISYGNKINAKDTINVPEVSFEDLLKFYENNNEKTYHSLVFINLDGNFNNSENEVLLWFKSNIQNGDFKTGKEEVSYLQPFPMRGTGWHRCAFLLFEHKNEMNFDLKLKKETENEKFNERNFSFKTFYEQYSAELVPVGLSFYQSEWDLSVKNVFHKYFELKEPVYEFEFESKFIPRFEKYPKEFQPFNWYIQDYADKKELNEQVIKSYMKMISPFEPHPEPAKYPLIDLKREGPRWTKFEMENMRKRRHQYSIIPFEYFSPTKKIQEQLKNLPYQQNKE